MTADHESWRLKNGGGTRKANLSWQGTLGDGARQCLTFLGVTVFSTQLDGNLKGILRTTANASEILAQAPYDSMLAEVREQLAPSTGAGAGGSTAASALSSAAGNPVTEVTLASLGVETSLVQEHQEELDRWLRLCKEHVSKFVVLFPEPDTASTLADLIRATAAGQYKPLEEDGACTHVCLVYDTKTAGESSTQPHARRPAFNQERYKKFVKAFMQSRNCQAGSAQ